MSHSKVSLKLMVHKTSKKILFGQADKGFIDFLFTILALPTATIFNLLSNETTLSPLGKLYHSFKNLEINDFQPKYHGNISFLQKPTVQISRYHKSSISYLLPVESSLTSLYYTCATSDHCGYFASSSYVLCPGCDAVMNKSIKFAPVTSNDVLMKQLTEERSADQMGYVKDKISFMVMEDLSLKPMSFMSAISMLSQFGVDDASFIEEKVVHLNGKLALDLLRASISCSTTVLSDVFLPHIHFEDSSAIVKEEKVVSKC